jgi:hypothetical protein
MSAVPSFSFQDMDAPLLDDKMDVASSPFRQPDDLDVDLDSVHDPSVIESLHDDMIDDPVDHASTGPDLMQDLGDEILPDDDMIDDANSLSMIENPDADYNMEAFVEEARLIEDEDEDILYEDEEETEQTIQQHEETVDIVDIDLNEVQQDHEEIEAKDELNEGSGQPPSDGQHDAIDQAYTDFSDEAPYSPAKVQDNPEISQPPVVEESAEVAAQPTVQEAYEDSREHDQLSRGNDFEETMSGSDHIEAERLSRR